VDGGFRVLFLSKEGKVSDQKTVVTNDEEIMRSEVYRACVRAGFKARDSINEQPRQIDGKWWVPVYIQVPGGFDERPETIDDE
jgi:hypothetical protein